MKSERIFKAIGMVDDSLLNLCFEIKEKKKKISWVKPLTVAACIVLALGLGVKIRDLLPLKGTMENSMSQQSAQMSGESGETTGESAVEDGAPVFFTLVTERGEFRGSGEETVNELPRSAEIYEGQWNVSDGEGKDFFSGELYIDTENENTAYLVTEEGIFILSRLE